MLSLLSFVSVFYFCFIAGALNYYQPLLKKWKKKDYSDADLLAFTQKLITKTNAIQKTTCKMIICSISLLPKSSFKMNLNGYKKLAEEHSIFTYTHLSVKNH
jgi:hypothetical protein